MRVFAIGTLFLLSTAAVVIRWQLFSQGILYGDAAAKMASLAVASIIVSTGALLLRLGRGNQPSQESSSEGELSSTNEAAQGASGASTLAAIAAILGLATTAFSVSELIAPNTPVAAAKPACTGVPVYGAKFFAITAKDVGANSRRGPGRDFPQVRKYSTDCTMGFDGYCIGPPEKDMFIGTPDQRWLIVHGRKEFIASAVVLSQSPESALGTTPNKECTKLGGLSQPNKIEQLTFDMKDGHITAVASGAAAIGYGLTTTGRSPIYRTGTLGTNRDFDATLKSSDIVERTHVSDGDVQLAAAICLADNVPVSTSLAIRRLTLRRGRIVQVAPVDTPAGSRTRLAQVSCNSSG